MSEINTEFHEQVENVENKGEKRGRGRPKGTFKKKDSVPDLSSVERVKPIHIEIEHNDWPDLGSEEWHDFVMNQFMRSELNNGYPKTDGLRRVAQILLGPIYDSGPVVLQLPTIYSITGEGQSRNTTFQPAVVRYDIIIGWHRDGRDENGRFLTRRFSDVAEINNLNTTKEFIMHATASAATKAEGRALRKALQLRTLSAEEMEIPLKKEEAESQNFDELSSDKVKVDQMNFIDMFARRLDINLAKLLEKEGIKELNQENCLSLIEKLKIMRQSKESIDESIKGYKSDE